MKYLNSLCELRVNHIHLINRGLDNIYLNKNNYMNMYVTPDMFSSFGMFILSV